MAQFPKFDEKNYSNYEADSYVLKYLNGVKSTKQRLSLIQEFCEFNGMNPEELILEHHEDTLKKPLEQTKIAKQRLHSFFGYLTNRNKEDKDNTGELLKWRNEINNKTRLDKDDNPKITSWNSARQYVYSKLTSFYKKNNVPVSFNKKEIPHAKQGIKSKTWRDNGDRVKDYTKILKKIRDALPGIRDKAILLCKVSSGMDDVDMFKLTIKNFNEGYFKDDNVCYLEGYRQKTDEYYQTFFNSEACDMINVYLKDRERKTEVLNDDSWLFVGNKKVDDKYTQFKPRLFAAEMRETCKMLNINGVTPKALRRQFRTNLTSKVDVIIIKRMMGQTVEVSAEYFLDFSNQDAFEEYYTQEIEEHTLLGNGNGRITKVKEELDALKKTINILSEENKELRETIKNVPNLVQDEIKKLEERMIKRQEKMEGFIKQTEELFEE